MKFIFWLILAVCLLAVDLIAQERTPGLAVAPVRSLAEMTDGEKNIIFNSLQSSFSINYELVSQEQYKKAEAAAFSSLSVEKCIEDNCIRKIQGLLQVERVVVLQIIREQKITQLTLRMVRNSDRIVRAVACENCSLIQLNILVGKLVRDISSADLGVQTAAHSSSQPTQQQHRKASTFVSPLDKRQSEKPTWALVAGIASLLLMAQQFETATEAENEEFINTRDGNDTAADNADARGDKASSRGQIFGWTGIGLLIFYFSSRDGEGERQATAHPSAGSTLAFHPFVDTPRKNVGIQLKLNW